MRKVIAADAILFALIGMLLLASSGPLTKHFFPSLYWSGLALIAVASVAVVALLATRKEKQ